MHARVPLASVLAAGLLIPAAAIAQAPAAVVLHPNTPRTGTKLTVDFDGSAFGVQTAPPHNLRLLVQHGFSFDPSAVKARCAPPKPCPAAARVGTGSAQIAYTFIGVPGNATAKLTIYLTAPQQHGDLAGLVVRGELPDLGRSVTARGRVLRAAAPDGIELRIDDLLGGQALPPGTTVSLARLRLSAGVSRTVTQTKVRRRKVHGQTRRVRVKVRTRHALITTPKTCSGAWAGRIVATLADGSVREQPLSAPCSAR